MNGRNWGSLLLFFFLFFNKRVVRTDCLHRASQTVVPGRLANHYLINWLSAIRRIDWRPDGFIPTHDCLYRPPVGRAYFGFFLDMGFSSASRHFSWVLIFRKSFFKRHALPESCQKVGAFLKKSERTYIFHLLCRTYPSVNYKFPPKQIQNQPALTPSSDLIWL